MALWLIEAARLESVEVLLLAGRLISNTGLFARISDLANAGALWCLQQSAGLCTQDSVHGSAQFLLVSSLASTQVGSGF